MKTKFTRNYLEKSLIRNSYKCSSFKAVATCKIVRAKYPKKIEVYKKMLKTQF